MGISINLNLSRCWVAAHMCVLSHFRTCDVRAEVRAERVCELCVRCRCVRYIFDLRCAIALFILVDKAADEYVYVYDLRFTYSSAPLSTRFKCTATYYTIFFQVDHINLARQDFFFFSQEFLGCFRQRKILSFFLLEIHNHNRFHLASDIEFLKQVYIDLFQTTKNSLRLNI